MMRLLQLVQMDLSAMFDYCEMAKYSAGTTPPLTALVTHLARSFHELGEISKTLMPDHGIAAAPRSHHYGLVNCLHSHRYILRALHRERGSFTLSTHVFLINRGAPVEQIETRYPSCLLNRSSTDYCAT
jgi:hypothetical protein